MHSLSPRLLMEPPNEQPTYLQIGSYDKQDFFRSKKNNFGSTLMTKQVEIEGGDAWHTFLFR